MKWQLIASRCKLPFLSIEYISQTPPLFSTCFLSSKHVRILTTRVMGAICVIKRRSLERYLVVALLLSLQPIGTVSYILWQLFDSNQLFAMQAIWGAWNTTTPHPESNLAGWSSTSLYPCMQEYKGTTPNWRGVQCLTHINCHQSNTSTDGSCSAFIIGLTINSASITGILPPEIGDITTLSTLVLTGNPNLTGPLPSTLQYTYLYILDLHDNALEGNIPNELKNLVFPVILDLSGNRFNGSFPLSQISAMNYLQTLNLGRNDFAGDIPDRAFENMTQLEHLDISNNRFTGNLPNLTMIKNLQILDMSSNKFMGTLPDLTNITSLQTVNLSRNEFTGPFELASIYEATVSKSLSVLDLSGNQLTGDLSFWNVSEIGSLQELYLDNNFISGTLDVIRLSKSGFLQTNSTTSLGILKVLSLSKNNITHVNYDVGSIEDIKTVFRLQDNPFCNGTTNDGTRCFCNQICFNSGSALKVKTRKIIIISTVSCAISVLVLLMIGYAVIFHRNSRYKQYLLLQVQQKFEEFDVKPTIYSYNELRTATRDFHPDAKLGQGGYGAVYKGILPNGKLVAVKQLFARPTQGVDDFLNEIVLITGMRHRNLVNLKGCCLRENQRLLVYEYVDNFDIDQILLAGPKRVLISWPARLKICLGVALGLHYLHELAQPRIIHRDIKAKNVLLDKNYEAKIADFGLALLFSDEQTHITTEHVAGTKGYLAPEYALLGQMSDKVDVFSFGVLCLEVVSGRRNMDVSLPPDSFYLVNWAWKLQRQGRLLDLVDPTLVLQDNEKPIVKRLINIALLCIQHAGEQRPSMARVVSMLQGDADLEVAVNPGLEDQYHLDPARLLAFGNSGVSRVEEVSEESPLSKSIRKGGSQKSSRSSEGTGEKSSSGGMITMSEIRGR